MGQNGREIFITKVKIVITVFMILCVLVSSMLLATALHEEFERNGGLRGHIVETGKYIKGIIKEIEAD